MIVKSKIDRIDGLTLIELLLVIGFIAVIFNIANPYFSNLPSSTKSKVDETNAKLLMQEIYANIVLDELIIEISDKENITETLRSKNINIPMSLVTGLEFQVFISETSDSIKSFYVIEINNGTETIEIIKFNF